MPFNICPALGSFCCFRTSKNCKVAVRKKRIACLLVQALPWLGLLGSCWDFVNRVAFQPLLLSADQDAESLFDADEAKK